MRHVIGLIAESEYEKAHAGEIRAQSRDWSQYRLG